MNLYPIGSLNAGDELVVHLLPDLNEENTMSIFDQYYVHFLSINDKRKTTLCPRVFCEPCSFCKAATRTFKKTDSSSNDYGRRMYRKSMFTVHAIIIEDPLGISDDTETFQLQFGKGLFNQIRDGLIELNHMPSDYKKGSNLIISAEKAAHGYKQFYAKFAKKSKLTPAQIELANSSLINLSDCRPGDLASNYEHIISEQLMWDILSNY